jgi:hypothetical protein
MKNLIILLLVIFNSFHTGLRCSPVQKKVFFLKFGIKIEYYEIFLQKIKNECEYFIAMDIRVMRRRQNVGS